MLQSAGTGPTTRLKKKWMSTRYATAISHILPSQHWAIIYLGETSFHTFTAKGSITQRAQFQYNDAVKNLRILKVNRYKNDLKTQTDIAGALWMYRSIKRSMVRTMKLGFGETNDRNKDSEDLIKTKDWAPDVDDANKFLRRFTLDRNPEIEKEYATWKEAHTPTVCQIAFLTALQQLEAGLAFLNYYRKFVPYFSAIARPLNVLKTRGFARASLLYHLVYRFLLISLL
ncbi:hypothetical protein DTO021D3_462 [Paecilomyces variotii]|nr:hypothetical protein DTO032I3_371 [Paecilomyces variotii]KAJ9283125.1 hypothetical protein DTO021D3_462 [Paecilomyces variotii]KAJ9346845.1 hypothetical protein DTO027B6_412 [Paecilomyces variotii]KAJ9393599.1 hypothetical protein DTO032I4_370 [Paecilomyces variotii]